MGDVLWEAIGWLGTAIIVVSMLQQRITRLRLINLVGCIVSLAYNLVIGVMPMVALNIVLAVIQVYHLVLLWRSRHDEGTYAVVTADARDDVVTHILHQHRDEIRQFNPGFRSTAESSIAFLVMKGDAVVGLVLAHLESDGTAVLDVDYVTPKYRDLTPGEFVFRRSGVWQELGVRTIRTAAGGPDYYPNLGFTARDGAWELAVSAD